jgi:hypothetical protein
MSNELFRIDEISNLGSSGEFSNVGKLIGGAKKEFSVGGARKKAEDKKTVSPINNKEVKTITMNNNTMETLKSPEEETPNSKNSPRNNKIINDNDTPDNKPDNDDNSNNNDNNNTNTKKTDTKKGIKNNENTPTDEELEDLLSEDNKGEDNKGEDNKDEDEDEDNKDEDNKDEDEDNKDEDDKDEDEDNNEKLKTALNNSLKEDISNDEGSILNLTALKDKFYEMLSEMRDEEVDDEDDYDDLKPLLHLFDDTNTRLAVLAKMRDDGLIKL